MKKIVVGTPVGLGPWHLLIGAGSRDYRTGLIDVSGLFPAGLSVVCDATVGLLGMAWWWGTVVPCRILLGSLDAGRRARYAQDGPLHAKDRAMPTIPLMGATKKIEVWLHPDERMEWLRVSRLMRDRDFLRGEGAGACRRMLVRAIKREGAQAIADLERMGVDLSKYSQPPAAKEKSADYGRADRIVHD